MIFKIHELIDEKKEDEILSLIKEDEILFDKYKSLSIMLNDLKEIKEEKVPYSLESKIIKKIFEKKRKRVLSLSIGFAFSLTILIFMIFPFSNKNLNYKAKIFKSNKNYKYSIYSYVTMSNIKNVELTIYIKNEKIEEKSGYLKIPKEEFNSLYDTLNEKGDLIINKIEGTGEKTDYINIKINYKNYPKFSISNFLGTILPYLIISLLILLPLPFLIKRYKKWNYY